MAQKNVLSLTPSRSPLCRIGVSGDGAVSCTLGQGPPAAPPPTACTRTHTGAQSSGRAQGLLSWKCTRTISGSSVQTPQAVGVEGLQQEG